PASGNTRFPAARYRLTGAGLSPTGPRQLRLTHRNRWFVDSPLEEGGFELPVPFSDRGAFFRREEADPRVDRDHLCDRQPSIPDAGGASRASLQEADPASANRIRVFGFNVDPYRR